jgi:hypothetical protein
LDFDAFFDLFQPHTWSLLWLSRDFRAFLKVMHLSSQVVAHLSINPSILVIMSQLASVDGAAGQPSTNEQSTNEPSILTNMTSGIEIEVLAFTPLGVDPAQHLSNALSKPVLLDCSRCNNGHPWNLPFIDLLDKSNLAQGSYAGWQITDDMSVRPDKDEANHIPAGSIFFSMEIVSRVMNFTKPTPCPLGQRYPCTGEPFEWNSQTEIFSIMQRIQEAFSGPGFCLANNKNTGLHIHYGNGKEKPPVRTSLGMFGVFTALERLFDSALTCSRMPLLPYQGHPDCGIYRPHAVYKYDQNMEENRWIGSLSYVSLQLLRIKHNAVTSGRLGDPQASRAEAIKYLREANAPGMLADISSFDDVGEFMSYHPNPKGIEVRNPRYLAINLTNLYTEDFGSQIAQKKDEKDKKDDKCKKQKKDEDSEKGTVEVRVNSGTMDPSEVWASYEFMGKLMLWLSTPGIDHNAIILSLWANPASTLLDLINEVAASQSTIDFYTDRLSSDWAARRYHRLTSTIDPNDPFKAFKLAIENNRRKDSRREAVDAKIFQKLVGGRYGQISDAFFKTLPIEVQDHPDSHILNMDTCDYNRWFDKALADHKASTAQY